MTSVNVKNESDKAAGLKKIDGMIKGVSKGYGTVQNLVQETGVAIIQHAMDYDDCSRSAALVRAVPARERNSLIGWFSKYSRIGVRVTGTGSTLKVECKLMQESNKLIQDRLAEGGKVWDIDGAKANNWYDDPAGANPEPKPLNTFDDFYTTIRNMLKREIKNAEKIGDDAKYTDEDRAKIKAFASTVERMLPSVSATVTVNAEKGEELAPAEIPNIPVNVAA